MIVANPAVLKQLGKLEAEVIGRKCYHLFHNTECSPLGCPMEAMLRSGKTETVAMEMRAAGGTYLVSCTPVLDEQGDLEKVIHIATDITERKRAEDTVRALSARHQATLAAVPDIIMEVDNNKIYTWANQAGLKFFGADVIGKEAAHYFEGEQETYNVVQSLFNGNEDVIYVESWQRRQDSAKRLLGWWCRTLKDAQGNVTGALSTARDITALKEYSEHLEQMVEARTRELRDAQEQLVRQERLAVLGQLAGGIAHELRSPLSAIKNAAYYFKMVIENPSPDAREMIEILDQQIDVSARIISSLLDFARPKTPTLQPVQLARVIEAAICQCTIPQNIAVVWQADESLPSIKVDAEQLQLVFSNLITNAVQAMPQGGQLTIAIQPAGNEMRVTISDTGVGIPAEALDKVFQPLYTTKAKGIGLGLALTRIIVEAHGGAITVTSEVGKRTTFSVSLPLA